MAKTDFTSYTISELLAAHSEILDVLRTKEIVRSNNNPTGDYTEWLVKEKLGLKLENKSAKGFDAIDTKTGFRYQIKGRRITPGNKSTQLSVIRNLDGEAFHFLVAVIFDQFWQVRYAAKIAHNVVRELAGNYRPHVNGHILHLRPTIFSNQNVEDISHVLRS